MTACPHYFVTGTDTEIGKTLVSCALLAALAQQGLRAAGMKPVAAGAQWIDGAWHNEDADLLAAHSNLAVPPQLALFGPKRVKVMLPVGLNPAVSVAVSEMVLPTPAEPEACVVRPGVCLATTTDSLASPHAVAVALLLSSPE